MYAIRALRGFSLIIVDSWSAAHSGGTNDEIARLDNEVFKPLIAETGASLLILDNTGHDALTDQGRVQMQHARGASAKGDKMEVTLFFNRPFEDNNYRTRLTVKKMRLDYPWPKPKEFETPREIIEFYEMQGFEFGPPAWPSFGQPQRVLVSPEPASTTVVPPSEDPATEVSEPGKAPEPTSAAKAGDEVADRLSAGGYDPETVKVMADMKSSERRAYMRAMAALKAVPVGSPE
jgi:hypothetical protein